MNSGLYEILPQTWININKKSPERQFGGYAIKEMMGHTPKTLITN